jgi:hypothetical protein
MITYLFPEPGSVPGIPGLFAGVRVDVEDDGTYKVSPLAFHPHFQHALDEETTQALPPETIEEEGV